MYTALSSPLIKKNNKKKSELGIPYFIFLNYFKPVHFEIILHSTYQKDIIIRDSEIEAFVQNIDIYR